MKYIRINIMKSVNISILVLLSVLFLFACDNAQNQQNETLSQPDSVTEISTQWKLWSERTAEGLWEGDPEHSVELCLVDTIYGESAYGIAFYICTEFVCSGDTLFIIDHATEQLVCMGLNGSVFWKYGEPGEGPGHFERLNSVCVGPDWIAIGDAYGACIEILSKEGVLIKDISEQNPNALITLNDTTFAMLSRISDGGDIHIYSVNSGYINSFGDGNWRNIRAYWNKDLFGTYLSQDSSLWVVSRFENQLYEYSLEDHSTSYNLAKKYPAEIPSSEQTIEGIRIYQILGCPFIGPEGMVNLPLGGVGFDPEGNVRRGSDDLRSPVTIIDRYNPDGQYLDSYCIPNGDFISEIEYSSQYGLLCSVYNHGLILRYEYQ